EQQGDGRFDVEGGGERASGSRSKCPDRYPSDGQPCRGHAIHPRRSPLSRPRFQVASPRDRRCPEFPEQNAPGQASGHRAIEQSHQEKTCRPNTSPMINRTMKTPNKTRAILAAVPATPPNPKAPATSAMIKNTNAQYSIR